MKLISVKESVEALAWGYGISYEAYLALHAQEFIDGAMDEVTFKEFCSVMERWCDREGLGIA